jgi:2-hydroxymuconate-semialdehyde hydrolase
MIDNLKTLIIDGLETAYYEAGAGPTVVLLHGGEHGANAELAWEFNFGVLAKEFHVLAPDWLGFGKSAKVHDFVLGAQRRLLQISSDAQWGAPSSFALWRPIRVSFPHVR